MNTRETLNNFSSKFSDTFKEDLYFKRIKNILSRETLNSMDYRKLHHNLCQLMFNDVKLSNEVWIQIHDLYSTDDNSESENSKNFIRVSLLNRYMLDYDRNMFQLLSSENADYEMARDIFRPYFLHFLIDVTKIDDKSKKFISNSENLGQWFKGTFLPNEATIPDMIDGYFMEGVLESSASPIHYEGGSLIIRDIHLGAIILNEINDIYDAHGICTHSDNDVNNELQHIFNNTKFSKVRVYNVGNGNCIYIKGFDGNQSKSLLYDIGYDMHSPLGKILGQTPYERSIHAIRSISRHLDCVILSHWDLDHILGCVYAPQYLFHRRWIAPNFLNSSEYGVSSRRMAVYLNAIGSLMLVDRNPTPSRSDAFARLTTGSSTISFWMGKNRSPRKRRIAGRIVARCKADSGITKVNREGIIVEFSNINHHGNAINSLLSGDVRYSSIPDGVNLINGTPIDYLVVPHHGSDMDYYELENSNVSPDACAIISASGKDDHPNLAHENALTAKRFQTLVTRDVDLYIGFSLLTPNLINTVDPIP